jgi:glycosyltransferase involved in cell wall biosynthesis
MSNNNSNFGISIVMPCYNAGIYLKEAVLSVTQQPIWIPHEIIVVDDGSDDPATKKALKEIFDFPMTSVIKIRERKGVQYARNQGIQHASYDFILMMDADDCLNPDPAVIKDGTYPDLAVSALLGSPDIAFVHGISRMFGEYNGYTSSAYPVTEKLVTQKHHVSTAIVYRKSDAISAGGYDAEIQKWQDWSFGVALLNQRYKNGQKNEIGFLEKSYYMYRVHNQGQRISQLPISEADMTIVTVRKNPDLFQKYYGSLETEKIAELVLQQKPNTIKDLIHMSSNNVERALELVQQRGYFLNTSRNLKNAP